MQNDLLIQPLHNMVLPEVYPGQELADEQQGTLTDLAIQHNLPQDYIFMEPGIQQLQNIILLHTPYLQLHTLTEIKNLPQ